MVFISRRVHYINLSSTDLIRSTMIIRVLLQYYTIIIQCRSTMPLEFIIGEQHGIPPQKNNELNTTMDAHLQTYSSTSSRTSIYSSMATLLSEYHSKLTTLPVNVFSCVEARQIWWPTGILQGRKPSRAGG